MNFRSFETKSSIFRKTGKEFWFFSRIGSLIVSSKVNYHPSSTWSIAKWRGYLTGAVCPVVWGSHPHPLYSTAMPITGKTNEAMDKLEQVQLLKWIVHRRVLECKNISHMHNGKWVWPCQHDSQSYAISGTISKHYLVARPKKFCVSFYPHSKSLHRPCNREVIFCVF